ncbi:MAG: hypothetical protein GX605_05665 [Chloroflexi bacterium]|nr:hypothetical protein [Chloroflexota bacterium]
MAILRLQHIGIVVKDIGQALRTFEELLGLKAENVRTTESGGKMLDARIMLGNDMWLHFMQNWNPNSRYYDMLEKEGKDAIIDHLTFESDDIEADTERIKSFGWTPYENKIFNARDGFEVFFLRDNTPFGPNLGATIELIQPHVSSRGYGYEPTWTPEKEKAQTQQAAQKTDAEEGHEHS